MARVIDYKRYGEELGDILALMELINRYLVVGRPGRAAKGVKAQNDKALVKLLKAQYALSEHEVGEVLKIVAGKKIGAVKAAPERLSDYEKAQVRKEIDTLIDRIGITIRAQNSNDDDFLRKVKGNLSVRKGKIMSVIHQTRERKTSKPS
ncbi:MAG: hypothetical protein LBN32_00515 [Helicobacteraceae bacterium]|nr:hypothetical protein [Helicobacteraceae bacterium]